MTADIAAILAIDGIATGAVYALVAIGTVLIFTVTRVIFIPFGDIAAFTALTLAALDARQLPGTVGLGVVLACMACVVEVVALACARARAASRTGRAGRRAGMHGLRDGGRLAGARRRASRGAEGRPRLFRVA